MIRQFLDRFKSSSNPNNLYWKVDPYDGLDFMFSEEALVSPDALAIKDPLFGMQYAFLKSLDEQGCAEKHASGYTIVSDTVPELEEGFFELFDLPKPFPGRYAASIQGNTTQAAFSVALELVMPDGAQLTHYELNGPFLKLAEDESYRLSPAEWKALKALQHHQSLEPGQKDEYENNWLVFQLQLSKKAGMDIDLAQFNNLELTQPDSIGVALEELPNGDLAITPTYGSGFDVGDIKARLGNLDLKGDHGVLRVGNRFALLDKARIEATEEILTNRRIPKEQVKTFLSSPTAYLNAALIDLDTGFSLRVHGAEKFTHKYFGDIEKAGVDWFGNTDQILESIGNLPPKVQSREELEDVKERVAHAQRNGADSVEFKGGTYDIKDESAVKNAFDQIGHRMDHPELYDEPEETAEAPAPLEKAAIDVAANDQELDFVQDVPIGELDTQSQTYRRDNLKRTPFPHQDEGIRWLLAHISSPKSKGAGALLADDMGLGKTYMTLVAIAEWLQRCKESAQQEKPTLIVAPLSLLENWQSEVFETFYKSPFKDIVVLQAGGDLKTYRIKGGKRETEQQFEEGDHITDADKIRYSLKVGKHYGNERLDMPGRLVLTTYQTLRDYQFSLSTIPWGVAAFDEAQNMKNPNALATRAAMGLNADFKLLATGTPVENSLKDFWCLMDIAIPGFLGAWQSFRTEYIAPILAADAESVLTVKQEVGQALRQKVGDFMLRRTKEEKLEGIPEKVIYTGEERSNHVYEPMLAAPMKGNQLTAYDEIIEGVRNCPTDDKRSVVLPSLHKLKIVSIHHDLCNQHHMQQASRQLLKHAEQSVKIKTLLNLLNDIKKRHEKVLIFATTKAVQAYVAALVTAIHKIQVDIINGETKAVASKKDAQTRKGIIDQFQQKEGFGVLVMSPVAAGVGLTVTGANNVIHLERHWNPAKEAQATDRVYRIGQKRQVNVYLPMALHPSMRSFDQHLNSLLENKIDLSDAVVAQPPVDAKDLESVF